MQYISSEELTPLPPFPPLQPSSLGSVSVYEAAQLWTTLLQLATCHHAAFPIQPDFIITARHFLPIVYGCAAWQHEETLPESLLDPS